MRTKVIIVMWAFVTLSLYLWLVPHQIQAQGHWTDTSTHVVFTPSSPYEYNPPDLPGTSQVQRGISASADGCYSSFRLKATDGYSYSFAGSFATLSKEKRMSHTGPAHSPMNAVASGSGTINFLVSVSGTVSTSGSSSGAAAASGSIAGLGGNTGSKSLSANGSCSATTIGSVGILRDGTSVLNSSPPPGLFSGADTHSAVLNVDNYVFQGDVVTMGVSASVTTSGSAISGRYYVLWYGMTESAGQVSVIVEPLTLDVDCQSGGGRII